MREYSSHKVGLRYSLIWENMVTVKGFKIDLDMGGYRIYSSHEGFKIYLDMREYSFQ